MENTYPTKALVIAQEKGGLGKTFLASSIAEFAARLGLNVLVVDTDIQANLTATMIGLDMIGFGEEGVTYKVPPIHPEYDPADKQSERPSIANAFFGGTIMPYNTWIRNEDDSKRGRVDILPAHGAELEQISALQPQDCRLDDEVYDSIYDVIQNDVVAEHYDLVVLDTNPTRNIFSRSCLRSATHCLIPFEFDTHSLDGFTSMKSSINSENNFRRVAAREQLKLVGILPNRFVNGSSRSKGISQIHLEEMPEEVGKLLLSENSFIPQAEVVKKVLSGKHRAESIFEINKKSKVEYRLRMALEHACIEVLTDIFNGQQHLVDLLDQNRQRVRREQKKFA